MKNPYELLRNKEQEILRVKKEIDALRIVARLMDADGPAAQHPDEKDNVHQMVELP